MMNTQEDRLTIEGMSCGHCIRAVEEALREIEGIKVTGVEIGAANIVHDGRAERRDAAVRAIEEAGFTVTGGPAEPGAS
jgi:copper chaperone